MRQPDKAQAKASGTKIERIQRIERTPEMQPERADEYKRSEESRIKASESRNTGAPAQQEYDIDALLETFRREYKG